MISFIIQIYKAARAFYKGFTSEEYRGLWALACLFLASGMLFYKYAEDLRWLDALYLSFCTLTTIGYGDFVPSTDIGKVFTMVYGMCGIGMFFVFINRFGELSREMGKKPKQND